MRALRLRIAGLRYRPALLLVAGRSVGFAAAFAIPVALARLFDQTEFGTYKQLFLIYATLFGIAQLGMAESLYYFVPRSRSDAGSYVSNALLTLGLLGIAAIVLLELAAEPISRWLGNPALAAALLPLTLFLGLMLASTAFEIVLVSRKHYVTAAAAYAASDVARALFIVLSAALLGGVLAVLWGAVAFASLRLAMMLGTFWREFRASFHPDFRLWRRQLAYALPFALAVSLEVVQANFHQYVVAARFDAAAFAIFAVGCLQIPLVDVIANSSANVMMVRMAEEGFDPRSRAALDLWHNTVSRLALLIFPLTAFLLLAAREIILILFTESYLASVPIFMLSTLMILLSVFCVDAMLRVHAQTRFLFAMNLVRLTIVASLIGWFLGMFGLAGAVLVTLLATASVRMAAIARIASLLRVGAVDLLPWSRLSLVAVSSLAAAVPAFWILREMTTAPTLVAVVCAFLAYAAAYAALCALWGGLSRPAASTPTADCHVAEDAYAQQSPQVL